MRAIAGMKRGNQAGAIVLMWLGAVLVLLPLGIVLVTSFAPAGGGAIAAFQQPTLANYRQAWLQGGFIGAFANTALVALAVTGLQAVTAALAGYALARFAILGAASAAASDFGDVGGAVSGVGGANFHGAEVGRPD